MEEFVVGDGRGLYWNEKLGWVARSRATRLDHFQAQKVYASVNSDRAGIESFPREVNVEVGKEYEARQSGRRCRVEIVSLRPNGKLRGHKFVGGRKTKEMEIDPRSIVCEWSDE